MAIDLISDVGAANSNSFGSLDEANLYFERRLALDPVWVTTGDTPKVLLIMATRILSAMSVARKTLRYDGKGTPYYYTSRAWTGTIASLTQSLPWPRIGMYDRLGRLILSSAIPTELKEAEFELAGQLQLSDRTLDNDIITQGITSIKAGTVALTFKDIVQAQVLPDMVINLMPPSWFTDEIISYAVNQIVFEAI